MCTEGEQRQTGTHGDDWYLHFLAMSSLQEVGDLHQKLVLFVRVHTYLAQDLEELEPHAQEVGQQMPNNICELPRYLLPTPTFRA